MTVYAVAESVPEGCGYLTAGTRYEVYEDDIGFFANDDKGRRFYSLWDEIIHLDGGNWTRIDEPTPSQTVSQDRAVDREQIADIIAAKVSGPALNGETWKRAHRFDQLDAADAIIAAFKKSEVGHETP